MDTPDARIIASLTGVSVLVVEDDPDSLDVVETDERIEQAGFASYVVKPVDPWALCAELQRVHASADTPG